MLISKVVLFHLATFFPFLSIVVEGVSMILDTLVFLPATSTAEMDVVEKEQINQDGSGQTLLPHSFLLTPGFVNTWWCNSWNHLQHCACASQCTHLVMGHFCPVNIYKLHLKSPWVHITAAFTGSNTREYNMSTAQLLSQPRENKHVQFLWLLEFSSSFPTRTLPILGSANSMHSEKQQDRCVTRVAAQQLCDRKLSQKPFLGELGQI